MPGVLAAVLDLVWPLACGGCGRPGVRWCAGCAALLAGPAGRTRPTPCPAGLPPVWAVARYDAEVRQAVVSWKDDGRLDLTGPLAVGLAASLVAALPMTLLGQGPGPWPGPSRPDRTAPSAVWIVPMPSRRRARRERGADPVRQLALHAAALVRREGWVLSVVPALRHSREVADQAGLDAAARAANLAGALEVRRTVRHRAAGVACVLVDDVVTTGATLAEGAAALRRAGAHPIGAAVVAATQRTWGNGLRGQVTKVREGD